MKCRKCAAWRLFPWVCGPDCKIRGDIEKGEGEMICGYCGVEFEEKQPHYCLQGRDFLVRENDRLRAEVERLKKENTRLVAANENLIERLDRANGGWG